MDRKPLLVFASALLFSLAAVPVHAQFTQQGAKLIGAGGVGQSRQGWSVATSMDGNTAVVGGTWDNGDTGAAWVYTRSGGVWSQQGTKLVGTGAVGAAQQGYSVGISADGNTIIVGGAEDNGHLGAAWVYTRAGGVWSQQGAKLVGTGAVGNANMGTAVALSADGNTALLGGHSDNGNVGATWVFTRAGSAWSQQGSKLVANDALGPSRQGRTLDLSADGNTAIVGGPADASGGAAWVFIRGGGTWSQQGAKLIGNEGPGGEQGFSVSISADGNTALVGADQEGPEGAAHVFTRTGGVWSQQGPRLVGSGGSGGGQGRSVALSADGNTALVGAYSNGGFTGAAWMFTRSGSVWSQLGARLVGTGAAGSAAQGESVAISGDGNTTFVGGSEDNGFIGAVWVYANPLVTNCRFASSVVSFSSENSPTSWSAQHALGPPDVYPLVGDYSNSWASLNPDDQAEFIELGFTAPAPINFVNVYEANQPGAITSISVKNPNSGLFEVVWTATPVTAPFLSRIYTATFPVTKFPVSNVRIDLDSPAVPGWNEIDAVGIGYSDLAAASQWATGVVGFSSQYDVIGWSAQQALGSPDVYPGYADDYRAWASTGSDDQREFLELSYATPAAINFVNVVETYNPGALDKVSVKNPGTGLFEEVWSGTAATAPAMSRMNFVSFPEPRFRVNQVRLDFNSPAVLDWNEIDAVGIGRCACQASLLAVPAPGAVSRGTIDGARPNPFIVSTGMRFSLAREGHVKVEVFNVLGQRVTSLIDGTLPAGPHEAHWNGRDAGGHGVASGIYYLRIASDGLSGTRKVVKVE